MDGALCGRWAQFLLDVPFLEVLTIGFIYEWRKGALEWN
jgi:NADH:ubiquinone oxidoreductase subunit 3 (subunit A)